MVEQRNQLAVTCDFKFSELSRFETIFVKVYTSLLFQVLFIRHNRFIRECGITANKSIIIFGQTCIERHCIKWPPRSIY